MNNDKVNELINAIGILAELWMITYNGFKRQGLEDSDAITHTTALMSILVSTILGSSEGGAK